MTFTVQLKDRLCVSVPPFPDPLPHQPNIRTQVGSDGQVRKYIFVNTFGWVNFKP